MRSFLIYFFVFLLIIFRFFSTRSVYHNGDKIRVTTRILQEPIRYSSRQKLDILGLKIYLPLFPEIGYGDKVRVEGIADSGQLKNPKLIYLEKETSFLFDFRTKVINFYRAVLPEPHASLLSGIILGSKSGLPADFWQALTKTGTAHVVVASGMNVTFVAGFLIGFLALFLPRRRVLPLALLGIWFYALLSGFEAPLVRAAVMASFAFTAQETGKLVASWRILVLTASVMLILKPLWLTDLGFILSFVATAGTLLFQAKINQKLAFMPKLLRGDLATTLAAQIGVAPILFVTFGQFNLLSPIINALVLWTVPLIMIIGGVGGMIGLIIPGLGRLILYLVYPLTGWFVGIVALFK